MNDSRFKELLNLYLDHEISPSDAAALEQEVRSNPERKKTFDIYCQLQKGSKILFEAKRINAPGAEKLKQALAQANRRIEERPKTTQRGFWLAGGSFATLAAAACIAFVITRTPEAPKSSVASIEAPKPTSQVVVAAAPVKDASIPSLLNGKAGLVYPKFEAKPDALKWTQTVQFRPVRKVESLDLMLKSQTGDATGDFLPAADENATNDPSQMTALQFKR